MEKRAAPAGRRATKAPQTDVKIVGFFSRGGKGARKKTFATNARRKFAFLPSWIRNRDLQSRRQRRCDDGVGGVDFDNGGDVNNDGGEKNKDKNIDIETCVL